MHAPEAVIPEEYADPIPREFSNPEYSGVNIEDDQEEIDRQLMQYYMDNS
jgi:hypothetical protein